MFRSIFFLNSVFIFITNFFFLFLIYIFFNFIFKLYNIVLVLPNIKMNPQCLVDCICFIIFSGFFSCSFIWNICLSLLVLFTFLCLYEVRQNSYLPQSRRHILVWEHPFAAYVCPAALAGELNLKWSQTESSLLVIWQPSCWEVGLDSEGLESEPGMSQG